MLLYATSLLSLLLLLLLWREMAGSVFFIDCTKNRKIIIIMNSTLSVFAPPCARIRFSVFRRVLFVLHFLRLYCYAIEVTIILLLWRL